MKRWIAALLTVAMLLGCFPLGALAEGTAASAALSTVSEEGAGQGTALETSLGAGGMTVEATNSFGKLLLDGIDQTNGGAEVSFYSDGNKITGLTVEGSAAVVDFSIEEAEGDLVVALYVEDEPEMLASGTVEVTAGQTSALVPLEGDIPDYFIAKAYLLEKGDHSPLCKEYTTMLYTEAMIDLVQSTIDDYAADRVLNLDEDPTTNFMVVNKNSVLEHEEAGQNIVVENDADSMSYRIENASERIQNLSAGDILVCSYGEDSILIAKVSEITVEGTTVSIQGENAEIDEVFDQIKIQASGATGEFEVDTSKCSEGLIYEGTVEREYLDDENGFFGDAYNVLFGDGVQNSFTKTESYGYTFKAEGTTTDGAGSATLSGYVQLQLGAEFSYLLSRKHQYVSLMAASNLDGDLNVSGAYNKSYAMGDFSYSPVWGVSIGLQPRMDIHAKAEIDYKFHATATAGMAYDSDDGFKDLSTRPEFTSKLTMEGMIEVDLDLNPYAKVDFGCELADVNMTSMVGLEIDAEMTGKNFEASGAANISGGLEHECNSCLKAELYYKVKVAVEMSLLKDLKIDKLKFNSTIVDTRNKFSDYYYSFDFSDSGFTTCPHYKTIVEPDVPEEEFITSGTCGAEGDGSNLTWTLDSDGLLTIHGTGKMENYAYDSVNYKSTAPWSQSRREIVEIRISEGVTNIGAYAFHGILGLTNVTIPKSVTSIGAYAFCFCWMNLTNVIIPEGVTSIGENAFQSCWSLTSITIPEGVTSIELGTFESCMDLTNITIPESVTSIGARAFMGDSSLTNITIPQKVTSIGEDAFWGCSSLVNITLPEGVTSIGVDAFWGCSSLANITIPKSVTRIERAAFGDCVSLTSITIPESLTSIESGVFNGCTGLTNITIPRSVTNIGEAAFTGCSRLADVYYSGNEEQWKVIAINASNDCLTSATIHYNSTGPDDATNGIFSGSAGPENTGWQASFENLIPNTDYAVIVSLDESDPLAAENLQYITQMTASASGTLTVYYRQSSAEAAPYVVACGSGRTSGHSNPGGSSSSSGTSGGGSGDGGAAAALLLAGVGAVAAVLVVKAILPVEVSGTVTDETGAALPGATVALWQDGAVVQQAVTDENGCYTVKMKKGGYDLVVSYTDPATGMAFQQTVTITAPDKERHVALDLSPLKVPAAQA